MSTCVYWIEDDVAVLRMAGPKGNVLDKKFLEQILGVVKEVYDSKNLKGLIITGTEKFFSTGLDLGYIADLTSRDEAKKYFDLSSEVFRTIFDLPIPTIAAINGHAVAGGGVIASACDFRFFVQGDYKFGFTGIRLGIPYFLVPLEIIKYAIPHIMHAQVILQGKLLTPDICVTKGIGQTIIPTQNELLSYAKRFLLEELTAPKKTYSFIKNSLHKTVHEVWKREIEKYDQEQLDLYLDPDVLKIIKEQALKFKTKAN